MSSGSTWNGPTNALLLSVDEKTQIQALDGTHPLLQQRPGQIERRTHDYKRHGTTNLYTAFNIATGEVLGRITRRHHATEFRESFAQNDRAMPPDLALHLIRRQQQHAHHRSHSGPRASSTRGAVLAAFAGRDQLTVSSFQTVRALTSEGRM